jgi:hypothetical protein
MNKREFITNLTPGQTFIMDGSDTVYEVVRVISMSPYTSVTYIIPGSTDLGEWTFTKMSLSTVTPV